MNDLKELFEQHYNQTPETISPLAAAGSNRKYYRMSTDGNVCVGVVGTDMAENKAFVCEARHFHDAGLPVPEVYAVSEDYSSYLQEDMGDTLLFDITGVD